MFSYNQSLSKLLLKYTLLFGIIAIYAHNILIYRNLQ